MILAVDRAVKPQHKQTKQNHLFSQICGINRVEVRISIFIRFTSIP